MKTRKKSLYSGAILFLSVFLLFLVFAVKPVKAYSNTTIISARGKTFYLVEQSSRTQYKNITKLYQRTSYGNKLVANMSYSGNAGITYSLNYGNKLYFCVEESGLYYNTYTYTIGKKGFKKERNGLKLIDRRGKYAIAYIHEATDIAPNTYCLYNLSSKKRQNIGYGYGIRFIGKKIYYVKSSKNMKQAQIIRCNYNGSGKRVLKRLKSSWNMHGFRFINAHKVQYHISSNYNQPFMSANKTVKF